METDEIELTEMHDLDVQRQDGVRKPASGFSFLVKKSVAKEPCNCGCAPCDNCEQGDCLHCLENGNSGEVDKDVNAVGGIDETPDIAGAERVLCELYKLLESEAREGAIGAHEECDVNLLSEAISLIKWFKQNEEWGAEEDDGSAVAKAELDEMWVCKAHRKFSSDDRKRLAGEGKALEDGSYPIPDADALRRAAILARSGHGDVAAAKKLIARRAKELGVANPLAEEAKKDMDETTETSEGTATPENTAVEKAAFDALAERVEKMESDLTETRKQRDDAEAAAAVAKSELDVLKATPRPGGPALAATAADRDFKAKSEAVQKAVYYRRMADTATDRNLITEYTKRAEAQEALAK